MELRYDRFERQLAGEALRPVYLISGNEPLRVQEAADAVRAKARAEGYDERIVLDADGSGFDWDELARAGASLSLFASRRLFDLRLPSARPGTDGAKAIVEYCENPPADTVLLITGLDWSSKHGGRWSETIARVGHLLPVWPVKPGELEDWLSRRLSSRGLSADRDALRLLAERSEGNLLSAAQEVDKLALLADGQVLDAVRLQALIADASRYDVFQMCDAALAGEAARALKVMRRLRAEGEQVPGLVHMLARELVQVANFARERHQGRDPMQAMREARIWESKQALYRRALDRHDSPRWDALVAACGQLDLIAKGRRRGLDPWLALERLLAAIADRRARPLQAA